MSQHETVLQYGDGLTAILTGAATAAATRTAVLILNAGIIHKVGPNRMHVQLARQLAQKGFPVLRLDFAGIGDSPLRENASSLADSVLQDVGESMDYLQHCFEIDQFFLVGLCAGADNAMRAAVIDKRVAGIVMLDPTVYRTRRWYLQHLLKQMRQLSFWINTLTLRTLRIRLTALKGKRSADERPEQYSTGISHKHDFEAHLRNFVERNGDMFVAFSGGWGFIYNYRSQFFDVYPDIEFGNLLTLQFYPDAEHTFDLSGQRDRLFGDISNWVESRVLARESLTQ